jgi:Flp pilus assembly protein TadB
VTWLMAAGAMAGAGIVLVIAGLQPAPPRLDAVLARLSAPGPAEPGPVSPQAGLGGWLAAHLARPGRLAIPRTDLALLGRSPETFLVHKLAAAAAGLGSFALLGVFFAASGTAMPWQIPAAASLAAGVGMFFFPDYDVRAEAARQRRDFTHAFVAYLQLVRLARTAGAASSEALEYAARVGDGWPFTRIGAALDEARTAHEPAWQHLAALGEAIGVPEVTELAAAAQIAGSEGAKIAATLAAKTQSLRGQLLAATRSQANSRTTTMIVPLSLLGLGLVLLMAFPAFYTLIYTT